MQKQNTLPPLEPFPNNISDIIRKLLQQPDNPALEDWLLELTRLSGFMAAESDLRWRVLVLVWLAAQFNVDKAWPYLMWLNQNEAALSDHLNEILSDAVNDYQCHIQMATWIANARDERLRAFFAPYRNIPGQQDLFALIPQLLQQPKAPQTGVWMQAFCRSTRNNPSPYMRPWRLLMSAWYAVRFDPAAGLNFLKDLSNGAETLSAEDNMILMRTLEDVNALAPMIGWLADCEDAAVKTMLRETGHPNLQLVAQTALNTTANYSHLPATSRQAKTDAQTFQKILARLKEAGISPKKARILDLGCGPLAPQSVLLNSAGYKTVGVDLNIPPAGLPASGLKQMLKRSKRVKAWKQVTDAYYKTLSQQSGYKLKWKKTTVQLNDVTRLNFPDSHFDVIICVDHLQHAPDPRGVLLEAARVLKPGGVFVTDAEEIVLKYKETLKEVKINKIQD